MDRAPGSIEHWRDWFHPGYRILVAMLPFERKRSSGALLFVVPPSGGCRATNRLKAGPQTSTLIALDCFHRLAEQRPQPVFHQVNLLRVRPCRRRDLADRCAANDVKAKNL